VVEWSESGCESIILNGHALEECTYEVHDTFHFSHHAHSRDNVFLPRHESKSPHLKNLNFR